MRFPTLSVPLHLPPSSQPAKGRQRERVSEGEGEGGVDVISGAVGRFVWEVCLVAQQLKFSHVESDTPSQVLGEGDPTAFANLGRGKVGCPAGLRRSCGS